MKRWKTKLLAAAQVTALAALLLTGCGSTDGDSSKADAAASNSGNGNTVSEGTKTWRLAFNQTEEHPQYRVMKELSEEFNKKTEGRYDIQLFPNETLGAQRETLEQVQTGVIEMSIVNNTHPGSVSDYFRAFDMPFLFDDIEEAIRFVKESPVMEEIKADTEQYGFSIATYLPAGTRSMFTSKTPVDSVKSMKGLKIRTMESDIYVNMMSAFGGSATPMAMGEMYTAIQSGVVDGAENNEITYVNSKYYEVAPYWSQTNHLIVPDWLIINTDAYNSLSEEDRKIFDELCEQAIDQVQEMWVEEVEELMNSLDTSKVTITTDVDTDSFKEAIAPVNEELVNSNEKIKTVYDAVMELK